MYTVEDMTCNCKEFCCNHYDYVLMLNGAVVANSNDYNMLKGLAVMANRKLPEGK